MKTIALLLGALFVLSAQTPAPPATSHGLTRHLEYQFGYNAKVGTSGQGTGTTTIDVAGPANDGGLTVSGADFWWNTVRARATNTCEVYANGTVACSQAPYAISPIQLTIYPLFGRSFFKGLSKDGTSAWKQTFTIKAAVLPGATGFAGQAYTWDCVFNMQGKGFASGSNHVVTVEATGTMTQEGGRYGAGKVKLGLLYDTVAKVPAFVSEERARLPQMSVYNKEVYQLKLVKLSPAKP